ncbi:MAG: cytochrome c biogenesis protein CcdA [Proteiniphilum sp.]|nr:cytochrome c biogenesis protein CcdA [Proteiniphilum sp.]MDD2726249.1 cytochrome c biogenesis protein CcdA [Proteiniphilum sp.]MDD3332343.1 cytochrome c biogenesis protein CcdA [Proteiniphilum sp.]MDD3555643.1 cytochrome c biogenesis protein CcdA [Proteiniphilum sp.]MDD3979209.1 cytochrome c biogenesis protein CcdA [Proteiniphilum sp.]
MKKMTTLLSLVLLFTTYSFAQDEMRWSFSLEDRGNGEVELVADVMIKQGWYVYDTRIPDGGPTPTQISFDELTGAETVGAFQAAGKEAKVKFDEIFGMQIGTFQESARFVQRLRVTDKNSFVIAGDVRAQACDDQSCTPPLPNDFAFSAADLPSTVTVAVSTAAPDGESAGITTLTTLQPLETGDTETAITTAVPVTTADLDSDLLWTPVVEELQQFGMKGSTAGMSLFWILLSGFAGGLIALVTPCVWPMIPMTVSFFLKRNKTDKKKAVGEALVYGAAIIVIYVVLGLIITAIFGASALNNMATSALFNLIFFALLVFFAIAFFGGFELVLPSKWTNKMDQKADTTSGVLSIFFMAFTLVLVSFSCTGPIIGTLLVEAATAGSIIAPAIGMLGFALALAIPFVLFAIFPSWLSTMPKSGGWLNSVKVVLGFLELALALKFLSVADLAYGWGILDREVFLVLWIIIFALLGFYLLGKIKFPGDSDVPHLTIPRLFLSIISLAFAVYMIPGLWGAPLKAISAFSPPLYTQDFNLYEGEVHAQTLDYETGVAMAKQQDKPLLIDFSGYGCVNCRKMEASVWTDPRVKDLLDNEYILVTLMVDDKTRLPEIIEVEENGRTTRLKTVGDKWSYLQRHKFGANAQPYYIALDHDGKPLSPSYAYDENVERYIEFLETGLTNFKK